MAPDCAGKDARLEELEMQRDDLRDWDEHGALIWQAGDVVPPGIYIRVDDGSHRVLMHDEHKPLPGTCDGHVALYRAAAPTFVAARSAEGESRRVQDAG